MGLYGKYVLPTLIDRACRSKPNMKQRGKVVPEAEGKVLEIGIGSGLNLPYYNGDKIKSVTGIDIAKEVWLKTRQNLSELPFDVDFQQASAEDIPAEDNSYDSIVITYSLCSIPQAVKAMKECRRVLKSNGRLLFSEHGKAPERSISRWQNTINPLWKTLGGGCHLNRNIPELIEKGGFSIQVLYHKYIPGWKPASYNYWGYAI